MALTGDVDPRTPICPQCGERGARKSRRVSHAVVHDERVTVVSWGVWCKRCGRVEVKR